MHPIRLSASLLLLSSAASAQFTRNTVDVPASASATENVDFADVDNDGDWDAGFSNGGDLGNQQSVIWINAFNVGDPVGKFTNRTTTQFPAIATDGRDIEFVDYDLDGDVDLYMSNTSQISNQTNRWWNNMGSQAGTVGFYQDQTAAHWSGLAQPGSSIPPSLLIGGGFVDFSCDCDFGDLDNDGDIDLVHSTYGGAFNGNAPTRIFLNDGAGHFAEFNPSGFQLGGINIANGNPGIWCQGNQSADTVNATGALCDVASTPLDIDVGDVDGDLDLDILHGARQEFPRMFQNRLAEQGSLAFRDVTGSAFPVNYSTGGGHYEQEMGDQDGDGDLDIFGLNWMNLEDNTLKNNGNGTFQAPVILPGSGSDDNEGDFFDYDNDGDLDIFVANFSGNERLYRNNGAGAYTLTSGLIPGDFTTTLDADCCDVDSDGDYDVFVANDGSESEWYLQNGTSTNDVTAPSFPIVEQAPNRAAGGAPNTVCAQNRAAGGAPTIVRAQHRDNAPYYINWYDAHRIDVTVNGGAVTSYAAGTTQGDTVRAAIPGNLVGTICYQFVSVDEYGNTGTSVQRCYTATGTTTGTAYCFGDGSGTACPCANNGAVGNGCANSLYTAGANIAGAGTASISADTVVLTTTNTPNSSVLFFQGTTQQTGGAGVVFGDGKRCAAGSVVRLGTKNAAAGVAQYPVGADPLISVRGLVTVPSTRTYQGWYRNAAAFCTASTFNLTNGYEIAWGV